MNAFVKIWLLVVALFCTIGLVPVRAQQRLSIDVRNIDIYTVVRMLATQSGRNIVVDNVSVKHDLITLRLTNVDFDTALHTLELSDGLQDTREGSVIYVGSIDAMVHRSITTPGGILTKMFALRYIPATCDQGIAGAGGLSLAGGSPGTGMSSAIGSASCSGDALTALKAAVAIVPPDSIVASSQRNAIIATGTADFIQSLVPILSDLDQPAQQVLYEVRVVDLEPTNDQTNYGLEFGGYDLSGQPISAATTTAFVNPSVKINAQLNALIAHGNGHTLATPRLVVLNNHTGDMLVGETLPISYVNAQTNALQAQFINVGVLLSLTPIVGAEGDVTTDIHPEFSSLIGENAQGLPTFTNRKIDTVLRVKSGQSIVIAGLIQDIFTRQVTSVPLFSDIPVVGGLFKNKQETHTHDEIVFVITPHIMTDGDVIAPNRLPGLSTPPLPSR